MSHHITHTHPSMSHWWFINKTLYELIDQEESEAEEIVDILLKKYLEYDVLAVSIGKRGEPDFIYR